jgi:hypothetical protein
MRTVPREIRAAVTSWKKEADGRKIPHDPVAETFAYCAADLEARIKSVEAEEPPYTVREFAEVHAVLCGTVRKWIAKGELEATKNSSGDWQIPRSSKRRKPARHNDAAPRAANAA